MKSSKQIKRRRRIHFLFDLVDRAKRNSVGDLLEEYEQISEELIPAIKWLTGHVVSLGFHRFRDGAGRIIETYRNKARITASLLYHLRINIQLELRSSRAVSVSVISTLVVLTFASVVYRQSTSRHSPTLAEEYRKKLSDDDLKDLKGQTVVLTPTLRVRSGLQTIRLIKLDSAIQFVRFHLKVPEQPHITTYRVVLTRVDDLAELLMIRNPKQLGDDTFEVIVPAHFFENGDYVLRLMTEPDEFIWNYDFQVSAP
jgi:hypothetical protein